MTKDTERPDFNPRHRIAGAIILVSLAVIFVPMLLDDKPPAESKAISEIPERGAAQAPEAKPETKVVVMPVTPPAAKEAAPAASAKATPVEPAPKPEPKAASAEKKAAPAPAAKPRPAAKAPAEKPGKGWVVQVGTFANADNAARLGTKLKSQGHAVSSEKVTVEGAAATRLRVGPFRDRSAALKAQAQIHKDVGVQGVVLAYP